MTADAVHGPGGHAARDEPDITEDSVLGGRVTLFQPRLGYRAAIDPVLLAASVPAETDQRVLDVGAGVGTASLCLVRRLDGIRVAGIERERTLVRLAAQNAAANDLADRVEFMAGDLSRPPVRLAPGTFDHVMTNPPFFEAARTKPSPDRLKARATVEAAPAGATEPGMGTAEAAATLDGWIRFCLLMVRPKGTVTVIHLAERLDALLGCLAGRVGGVVVFPLWPGPAEEGGVSAKPAKRVIVRARRGVQSPLRLAPGLVLHRSDGAFTQIAESVLRDGAGLAL
ncbi:MAG: methyltransferase [Rhodospirillales bacterium]|nr:methyltransferase [Rhodospirillales bacterium]